MLDYLRKFFTEVGLVKPRAVEEVLERKRTGARLQRDPARPDGFGKRGNPARRHSRHDRPVA